VIGKYPTLVLGCINGKIISVYIFYHLYIVLTGHVNRKSKDGAH